MTGFSLPENFTSNLEALLKKKTHTSSANPPAARMVSLAPSLSNSMAQKITCESSAFTGADMPTRPVDTIVGKSLNPSTKPITMVQGKGKSSKATKDRGQHPLESVRMISNEFGKPYFQENYDYLLHPPFVTKKEDPSHPTIKCSIGPYDFDDAFCDLGVSINLMSKVTYERIHGRPLSPTKFRLQMADSSTRVPEGMVEGILVMIKNEYVCTDFAIYAAAGFVNIKIKDKIIRCPFTGYKHNQEEQPRILPNKPVWKIETATPKSSSFDSGTLEEIK